MRLTMAGVGAAVLMAAGFRGPQGPSPQPQKPQEEVSNPKSLVRPEKP